MQSPLCLAEESPSSGNDHAQRSFQGELLEPFPRKKGQPVCQGSQLPALLSTGGSRQGHSPASLHLHSRALSQEGQCEFVTRCVRGLIQTFREEHKVQIPYHFMWEDQATLSAAHRRKNIEKLCMVSRQEFEPPNSLAVKRNSFSLLLTIK